MAMRTNKTQEQYAEMDRPALAALVAQADRQIAIFEEARQYAYADQAAAELRVMKRALAAMVEAVPPKFVVVDVEETVGGFSPYATTDNEPAAVKLADKLNDSRKPGYKHYAVYALTVVKPAPEGVTL